MSRLFNSVRMMVTCRRHYLDALLETQAGYMNGRVLDIGGKKTVRRGRFIPPLASVDAWLAVNPDPVVRPDLMASGEALPFDDGVFDWIMLCEVIEHVPEPAAVLAEAHRVLRAGGRGVISVPFLVQVHADPDDYMRWTAQGLTRLIEGVGFRIERLEPMGGLVAVVFDLVRAAMMRKGVGRIGARLLPVLGRLALRLDRGSTGAGAITTGWFVVVSAPDAARATDGPDA